MSRLSRVTQIIFGGTATNNGVFGSAQLGTPTTSTAIATIMGGAAWLAGWLSATLGSSKFPALEEMQGVDYVLSTQIAYLLQQGIAEYDSGTTYYTHNIVCNPGTYQIFGSLTDTNVGNALPTAPASNTNWLFLGDLSTLATPSNNVYTAGTTTGSANAQVAGTTSPVATSFTNGQSVVCTAGFTNTGSMTFGAGGETPVDVKKDSGAGLIDVIAGDVFLGDTIIMTKNISGPYWVLTAGFPLGTAANKAASDNTKSVVASVSGSFTSGHLLKTADTAGTVQDAGAFATLLAAAITGSLGTNGYIEIPNSGGNPLIFQWYFDAVANNNASSRTTSFPTANPNNTYFVGFGLKPQTSLSGGDVTYDTMTSYSLSQVVTTLTTQRFYFIIGD